jgi:hypothetical protein
MRVPEDDLSNLPPLPLEAWEPSRLQLQLVCQMIGKVRLALHPPMNHWWHVTLYLSARGVTTGSIPYGAMSFDLEIDLIDHMLVLRTSLERTEHIPLAARPIADCFADLMGALMRNGIIVEIDPRPYKCNSDIPFDQDRVHASWDHDAIGRAFEVLRRIEPVFKTFRSGFVGKVSPVHLFWHSFDLAVTRFSGRRAPELASADPVAREAYSHEVSSAGFWFGDDRVPEPAFFSYAAPPPSDLAKRTIRPPEARWLEGDSPLALFTYEDLRRAKAPRDALLEFLQSTYDAAAEAARWDRAALELRTYY